MVDFMETLKLEVESKMIIDKIISCLLKYMVVSKVGNDKNSMKLDVFLSYEGDDSFKLCPVLKNDYEFMRGYDVNRTKRYKVFYQVNYYIGL